MFKMVHYEEYVAGWLDSSVHDSLGVLPANSRNAKYALITCIDSNVGVRSLLDKSPELKRIECAARSIENGLLLPTKLLIEADLQSQIFFGFDEIWFFP